MQCIVRATVSWDAHRQASSGMDPWSPLLGSVAAVSTAEQLSVLLTILYDWLALAGIETAAFHD